MSIGGRFGRGGLAGDADDEAVLAADAEFDGLADDALVSANGDVVATRP